jgi:hypothetical protein
MAIDAYEAVRVIASLVPSLSSVSLYGKPASGGTAMRPARIPLLTWSVSIAVLAFSPSASAYNYRIEETEITLEGEWQTEYDPEYSQKKSVYANFDVFDPRAHATFTFEGTAITWIGARTYNAGLFLWIIDEGTEYELRDTVNTYIPGVDRYTTELLADNLAPGYHTFKFQSLGIHGYTYEYGLPSETYIDAFDIEMGPIPVEDCTWGQIKSTLIE